MKKERVLKPPVPSKYLEKIGDITVSFASLENEIEFFIWALLESNHSIGQIITAELSFKKLRAVLVSLYKERYGENNNYKKLIDLMNRAGKIEEKRNQITHSLWGSAIDLRTGKDIDIVARLKTTAKEKFGLRSIIETFTVSDLSKIARDIKKLAAEIQDFNHALLDSKLNKHN